MSEPDSPRPPGAAAGAGRPAGRWHGLPTALRSPATAIWGVGFLAIFLAVHWQEVTSPTLNVDDWALIGSTIPQAQQSRPAWDLVFGLLFQHAFSPFFGWLLAAGSLFAIAAVLPLFLPSLTAPWILLAALLISLHAYLLDLFNFSFAIGLYLLPGALTVWGGVLIAYNPCPPLLGRRWRDAVLGVAMVVLAMGIYQPAGALGLVLIGLDALARALGSRQQIPGSWLRLLAGTISGSFIYYVIALLAMGGQTPNERTGFASLPRLMEKVLDAGVYKEVYATDVSLLWRPAQILLSCVFLLLLIALTISLWRRIGPGRERRLRLGMLWLAAGWLTQSPFLLFVVLEAGFPRRSFCLGNVGIVAFSVIALAWLAGSPERRHHWVRLGSRALVGLLIVGYVIPQSAFASRVWELTQLLERRDMAMAQAIAADVRALSLRGTAADPPPQTFRLFGTTERNQPFPHWSSVGESAFRQSWSIQAIFQQLLGIQVEHLAYRSEGNEEEVRRSLPRCRAWPERGSIVAYRGEWLVCLEPNPADRR